MRADCVHGDSPDFVSRATAVRHRVTGTAEYTQSQVARLHRRATCCVPVPPVFDNTHHAICMVGGEFAKGTTP